MTRLPTVKEVAEVAGVSVGTVSHVLNHPDRVAEATRQRVEAAIRELGFVRNNSALALRQGRAAAIGLVVIDVSNPFFTEVARGAEDVAADAGYVVILCNSDGLTAKEERHLVFLEEQRVAGLLITPVATLPRRVGRLRERGTHVVLVDRRASSGGVCSVAVDNIHGGKIAGEHLLHLGHRSIALLNGPRSLKQCADRERGFLHAIHDAAARGDVSLSEFEVPVMNVTAGEAAAAAILNQRPRPTAVFCTNDMLALGMLRAAQAAGLRVPDDIAILGYDDIEYATIANVPLTSVRQPAYDIGRAAAGLLFEEIRSPGRHKHQTVMFKPELVARASTAAPEALAVAG